MIIPSQGDRIPLVRDCLVRRGKKPHTTLLENTGLGGDKKWTLLFPRKKRPSAERFRIS